MSRSSALTIGVAGPIDLARLGRRVGALALSDGLRSPVLTDLVVELADRGHRVHVFTLSPDPNDVGEYGNEMMKLHVGLYRARKRGRDLFREERRALVLAMRTNHCDVLHAHWTYEFAIAALHSGTAPVLVSVHDWGPKILRLKPDPYRLVRLLMQAYVLLSAHHLTAVSPYIAEKVSRWFRRTISVVPNGVGVPINLHERSVSGQFVIGSVNNGFTRLKNVRRLIDAFKLIRAVRPDATLRLVGADFQEGGPAEKYARRHDAIAGVEFLGPVPATEIAMFMRSIDVYVHPSLEESFGTTLVEAMTEGALVVAGSNSGAVPWVLDDGRAGVLADVTDVSSIAEAVLAIESGETDVDSLRMSAFKRATEEFSIGRVADLYEICYRRALEF